MTIHACKRRRENVAADSLSWKLEEESAAIDIHEDMNLLKGEGMSGLGSNIERKLG